MSEDPYEDVSDLEIENPRAESEKLESLRSKTRTPNRQRWYVPPQPLFLLMEELARVNTVSGVRLWLVILRQSRVEKIAVGQWFKLWPVLLDAAGLSGKTSSAKQVRQRAHADLVKAGLIEVRPHVGYRSWVRVIRVREPERCSLPS